MTRVMAVELAPLGIRVNVIAPGPIETPIVREVHTPARPRHLARDRADAPLRHAGGRRGGGRLSSRPGQSGYVTGQTLAVDGGFTIAGILTGTAAAENADG